MKLRELLSKLNDIFRPMHVEGEGGSGSDPLLDGRVAGRAGNLHSAPTSLNPTDFPRGQDEEAHH
jgi:hypothetical protein